MKLLLLRLAGGYAGAGALAFVLYSSWHRRTRAVREWADHQGREAAQALDDLRAQLLQVRAEMRQTGEGAPELPAGTDQPTGAPLSLPERKQNRRPTGGTPEQMAA